MLKKFFIITTVLILLAAVGLAGVIVWGYYYFSRDLPRFASADEYRPYVVSGVYAADGTLIGEFFKERRYLVKLDEVPMVTRQAFLASEDADFYSHPGIDLVSIIRAAVKNFQEGSAKQGASTITQQVVKNLLLTKEKRIERKIKEAILAYRIEGQLSKDQIFEIYLNEIFFGNKAHGIQAAARAYFHKDVGALTLAESALLAGLPKAPSRYSPIRNMEEAKRRQRYVLGQMEVAGFITADESSRAYQEQLMVYRASLDNIYHAPYYVSEVRRQLQDEWRGYNVDTDGLEIHTPLDLRAYKYAEKGVQRGLKEVDKRRGWRGPIDHIELRDKDLYREKYRADIPDQFEPGRETPALVTSFSPSTGLAQVEIGADTKSVDLKKASWARRKLTPDDTVTGLSLEKMVRPGDVIQVSLVEQKPDGAESGSKPGNEVFALDQTPEIEGALSLLDPHSGKVVALIGGYSYKRSLFNRATQSLRQPGSAFKPIVYLTAVKDFKFTASTIVHDEPRTFKVGDTFWSPGNFDKSYLGSITLQTALEKSRNLVSADIISRIGVDAVIHSARTLGITSPLGRHLSLSLGSSEVTPLEITRAYGVFPARGVLFDSVFVTKVTDRSGQVLFDYDSERLSHAKQVIDEGSAFVMAHMMKGVIDRGTGYRVKALGRPVGGKTGTSNDQMDAWFIGFTPSWVCGVWVGFDVKRTIGPKETGGVVSAPIWLYVMSDFLRYHDERTYEQLVTETEQEAKRLGIEYLPPEPLAPLDFTVPEGVEPYWVDRSTGVAVETGASNGILEYFLRGTEPPKSAALPEDEEVNYLDSPEL